MTQDRNDLGARKHVRVHWRRGELIGARFVSARELRQGQALSTENRSVDRKLPAQFGDS